MNPPVRLPATHSILVPGPAYDRTAPGPPDAGPIYPGFASPDPSEPGVFLISMHGPDDPGIQTSDVVRWGTRGEDWTDPVSLDAELKTKLPNVGTAVESSYANGPGAWLVRVRTE